MAYQGPNAMMPLYDSTVQQAPGAYPWGPTQPGHFATSWGGQQYGYTQAPPTAAPPQQQQQHFAQPPPPPPGTNGYSVGGYSSSGYQGQDTSMYIGGQQYPSDATYYDGGGYGAGDGGYGHEQQNWSWNPPTTDGRGGRGAGVRGRGARGGPPTFGGGRGGRQDLGGDGGYVGQEERDDDYVGQAEPGHGRGGPPALMRGRGGPPSFGRGRGGPPEMVRGRGESSHVGRGLGGPPEARRGRGAPSEFGRGRGGAQEFGRGRGAASEFGRGLGGGSEFERGREAASEFGRGRGGGSEFGRGRGAASEFGRGRGGGSEFGRGRGAASEFGRGRGGGSEFGRGRGAASEFGRGRGEPPEFGSERGRQHGERGRGRGGPPADRGMSREQPFQFVSGGGRPTGDGGRGRGGPSGDRGRGRGGPSGDRGRGRSESGGRGRGDGRPSRGGFSDRGRGGMFRDGGRGRGQGRAGNRGEDQITVADTGVGLSSISDVIKSAQQRQLQGMTSRLTAQAPLSDFLMKWKAFSRDFVDCGNPISNLECSLQASKLDLLQLYSETNLLLKVSTTYNIFTCTLTLKKRTSPPNEGVFLARGLGLNKKAAKADCYQKAHKLLMDSSVNEIMSQVDIDPASLKQEINILNKGNPKGFMELLKKNTDSIVSSLQQSGNQKPDNRGPQKRKAGFGEEGGSGSKRLRPLMSQEDYSEMSSALLPKKKQGILMDKSAPLLQKLIRLKELLKEEGITKLHIVPKIDQFAHKTAISIHNVYKFIGVPALGYESKTPVYCEIYFDNIWMASSTPYCRRNAAMHEAYSMFTDRLCTKPVDEIAKCTNRWSIAMESMPDVCTVVTKWQGQDNDGLLTSNLANMKQMMQSMPNLKYPIEKMVLTAHETDENIENVFKSLELSATRNLVLLECELLRNPTQNFTCNISLQGKVMASKTHAVKNTAKRYAAEAIMEKLQKTSDFIYISAEYVGETHTKESLFKLAQEKKDAGIVPSEDLCKLVKQAMNRKTPVVAGAEYRQRIEEDQKKNKVVEDLPENVQLRPLFPYFALVIYDIIDKSLENLSLEDVIFDVRQMARSHREIIGMCASKMGLRINTKVRNKDQASLLRKSIIAPDMSKILQIHGGTSGRYKLIKCNNRCSKQELDEFRADFLADWEAKKAEREMSFEEDMDGEDEMDLELPKSGKPGPTPVPGTAATGVKSSPSAWENNEPLKFKSPQGPPVTNVRGKVPSPAAKKPAAPRGRGAALLSPGGMRGPPGPAGPAAGQTTGTAK